MMSVSLAEWRGGYWQVHRLTYGRSEAVRSETTGSNLLLSSWQGRSSQLVEIFRNPACQLARSQPSLETPIRKATLHNPDTTTLGLRLIHQILSQVSLSCPFSGEILSVPCG